MTYTARSRERHRLAVSAVTGVLSIGSLTSVGWLTGSAAREHQQQQADQAAQAALQQARVYAAQRAEYEAAVVRSQRKVVLRERPKRVRVTTRYVTAGPRHAIGAGGTLSSTSSTSGGSSGQGGSGPSGPVTPPPPPPPPPPLPSSGS